MGSATPRSRIVLAVAAPQVGIHVAQRPVPVDAWHTELTEIGQERVSQRAGLPGEPVRALGHPVADRKIALFLADVQQCVGQLDGTSRVQGGDQRQLGAVDVPHRADVEHEGSFGGPHGAFLGREARLDQRVIEGSREDRLPRGGGRLDLDLVEVLPPDRCRLRPSGSRTRPCPIRSRSADCAWLAPRRAARNRIAAPAPDRARSGHATSTRTDAAWWAGSGRSPGGCHRASGAGRTTAAAAIRRRRTPDARPAARPRPRSRLERCQDPATRCARAAEPSRRTESRGRPSRNRSPAARPCAPERCSDERHSWVRR